MECVGALAVLEDVWLSHQLASVLKIIKGGKDIISDGLN